MEDNYRSRNAFIRCLILSFLLMQIAYSPIFAQSNIKIFPPNVASFSKYQYNALSKNWSIAHDQDGLIYAGNDGGLLCFDGVNWKLYPLPENTKVRSVYIANDNTIYTGSYEEFGYWRRDEFGKLNYTSLSQTIPGFSFHNEEIWKIVEDDQGNIYFQGFSIIFRLKGDKVDYLRPSKGIVFLLKARDKMVAGYNRGNLAAMKDFNLEDIPGSRLLNKALVRVFLPYGEDGFLIGSARFGLFLYRNNKFEKWNCPANSIIADKEINCGYFDGKYYYIGTIEDGLYLVNTRGEIVFHLSGGDYLPDKTVLGIDMDPTGRIWVAQSKGISCIDFNYPVNYFHDKETRVGVVYDAAVFRDKLYLGTNLGVFKTDIKDKFIKSDLTDFEPVPGVEGQVWSLEVFNNQLLCGHNQGTYDITNDQSQRISSIGGGYGFEELEMNGEEYLVQNTYTSLVIFDKDKQGKWKFKTTLKRFSEPSKAMAIDAQNNIWVTHSRKNEVYKISLSRSIAEPVEVRQYKKSDGLPSDYGVNVYKFLHRIVFTSNKGIYTYDDLKDSVVYYAEINKQLGNFSDAHKIVKGQGDSYWFIKPRKVASFKMNKDNVLIKETEYFFKAPLGDLVEGFENIVPFMDSTSIFCLENGIATIRENILARSYGNQFPVRITNIKYGSRKTGDQLMPLGKGKSEYLRIPYTDNYIHFEFTSLVSPGTNIQFQYYLEGLDDTWNESTTENRMTYSRLPWGNYVFKVKAFDAFGQVVGENQFEFEIIQLWYTRTWVVIIFVLILASMIGMMFQMVRRYHLKKRERLLKEEQENLLKQQKEQQMLSEQEIIKLKNENLQKELAYKSNQLANATMVSIRKNEVLQGLKDELSRQKEALKYRFPEKYFEKLVHMIDKNMDSTDDWELFEKYFDETHVNFFSRLKETYSDLTPKDLRLCAYLKMNLTSKEIAALFSISPRSVEVHRYRLRKKLKLQSEDNLSGFLISF